jgi:hypothetical protein
MDADGRLLAIPKLAVTARSPASVVTIWSAICSPQALSDAHRCLSVRLWQHDCKLFAAIAGNPVVGAQAPEESSADLGQDFVADSMSMRIVDELEMVDVDEDQRQRSAMALGVRRSRGQLIVEVASVERATSASVMVSMRMRSFRCAQRSLEHYDAASRRQAQ